MPLPHLVAPASAAAVGRHVFVSYSHRDAELAEPVVRALHALAGNAPALGLAPERIFFDRQKLQAGDDWDESIRSNLQRADLFLLLVSTNSLTSRFCLEKELAGAAALGIAIVPVLLSPTPAWETRPVPGDAGGRALGAFNAVPINGKSGPQPIRGGNWATRDRAIEQAVMQIAQRLERDDAVPALAADGGGARPARRSLPPLLTSLCNQLAPVDSFDSGLDRWQPDRALMVLVKGEYADDTPGFWARLRTVNLAEFCEGESLVVGPAKTFDLPRASEVGAGAEGIARAVRRSVSSAIFGNARRMASGADLAPILSGSASVLPLMATLPEQPPADARAVIGALLALIDEIPPAPALRRLVVAILVESPELLATPDLAGALALGPLGARTHLVETSRLQALTHEHVILWHRRHELEPVLRLDEAQLVERLFEGAALLRHRPFDQRMQPLLTPLAREN